MNFKINRLITCKLVRDFSLSTRERQKKNYYDSLGVTPKATQGDVKTAYYKLSKLYHPDMNKGNIEAADKFKDITAAYEILGNVKTRKMYDRGLLVGGYEEVYDESTDVSKHEETYQHASFYHHRNKPTTKKTQVKSEHYDIDAWTKAHYSSTFHKEHSRKREEQKNRADMQELEKDTHMAWQIVCVLFLLSALVLHQASTKDSDFDRPQSIPSLPKDGKP